MDSDKKDPGALPVAGRWQDCSKEELWLEVEQQREAVLALCQKLRKIAEVCERHSIPWSDEFKLGFIRAITEEYLDPIYA